MVSIPFGRLFGTRSGDKGGAPTSEFGQKMMRPTALHTFLTIERLKALLPDTAEFEIDRYELANVRSLNFFIKASLVRVWPLPFAPTRRQKPWANTFEPKP